MADDIIKTYTTKKGRTVYIRPLRSSDTDQLLAYANAIIAEDTLVMLSGSPMSYEEEKKYVNESLRQITNGEKIHIIAEMDGVLVGSAEVRVHDRRSRHVGNIGISLSEEYRDEGIGSVLMNVLVDEAKKKELRLLYLHCFENNVRARHVYEKMGFLLAGIIPGFYAYKDTYIGEVTYYKSLL